MKVNDQLSENELIATRIAALRIHVERAIGRIKIIRYLVIFPITCLVLPTKYSMCAVCYVIFPLHSVMLIKFLHTYVI